MNQPYLDAVEIEPETPATHAVIWLHGLGADGHDFEPIVPHLGLDSGIPVRFVFPHAPSIPVTINAGMVMPAWYDITELELNKRHDENGIRAAAARIAALIEREHERGIPASRLVLAGFSQGGAIALHVALRRPERLLGVVALSSYLVLEDTLEQEATPEGLSSAFFQAHGVLDPTVPHDRGIHARDRLQALGCTVEWHDYPMFHEVSLEEIEALGKWLNTHFQGEGAPR
jgi:phospholipase/carboxylesterase